MADIKKLKGIAVRTTNGETIHKLRDDGSFVLGHNKGGGTLTIKGDLKITGLSAEAKARGEEIKTNIAAQDAERERSNKAVTDGLDVVDSRLATLMEEAGFNLDEKGEVSVVGGNAGLFFRAAQYTVLKAYDDAQAAVKAASAAEKAADETRGMAQKTRDALKKEGADAAAIKAAEDAVAAAEKALDDAKINTAAAEGAEKTAHTAKEALMGAVAADADRGSKYFDSSASESLTGAAKVLDDKLYASEGELRNLIGEGSSAQEFYTEGFGWIERQFDKVIGDRAGAMRTLKELEGSIKVQSHLDAVAQAKTDLAAAVASNDAALIAAVTAELDALNKQTIYELLNSMVDQLNVDLYDPDNNIGNWLPLSLPEMIDGVAQTDQHAGHALDVDNSRDERSAQNRSEGIMEYVSVAPTAPGTTTPFVGTTGLVPDYSGNYTVAADDHTSAVTALEVALVARQAARSANQKGMVIAGTASPAVLSVIQTGDVTVNGSFRIPRRSRAEVAQGQADYDTKKTQKAALEAELAALVASDVGNSNQVAIRGKKDEIAAVTATMTALDASLTGSCFFLTDDTDDANSDFPHGRKLYFCETDANSGETMWFASSFYSETQD